MSDSLSEVLSQHPWQHVRPAAVNRPRWQGRCSNLGRVLSIGLVGVTAAALASSAISGNPAGEYWINGSAKAVGAFEVTYEIESNLPAGAILSATLMLQRQDPKGTYVGTTFQRVPWNGIRASGRIDAGGKPPPLSVPLPTGDYWVQLAFYPRWPENVQIATRLQIAEPIKRQIAVKLVGSGVPEETARAANAGRRWVMENVRPSDPWDMESWKRRFGNIEKLSYRGWKNPAIVAAYWVQSIDVTVQVNTLTGKIINWPLGRNES